jgi:hypothetical protein
METSFIEKVCRSASPLIARAGGFYRARRDCRNRVATTASDSQIAARQQEDDTHELSH